MLRIRPFIRAVVLALLLLSGYASNLISRRYAEASVRSDVERAIERMRTMRWNEPVPSFVARETTWLDKRTAALRLEHSSWLAPVYGPGASTPLPWAYIVTDIRVPFLVRVFFGSETTGQGGSAWVRDSLYIFGYKVFSRNTLLGMS